MPKLTIRLAVAVLTFLIGVSATLVWFINRTSKKDIPQTKDNVSVVQEKQALRLIVPDASWEPIFFKAINERIDEASMQSLRTVLLPGDDDLEVRVWVGFGQNGIDGLVLRRLTSQWSGLHLHGMFGNYPPNKYQQNLAVPKSGWEGAWQRLVNAGILTLPDATTVQCSTLINDGMSYVVEINMDKTYRTYLYDNPKYAKCSEAKQMIRIGNIIAEEFGLKEFSNKE
jgi:hypothetical protein